MRFAWRDGPLLRALKNGHWVLLDEVNGECSYCEIYVSLLCVRTYVHANSVLIIACYQYI